jgi:hypothetical protein
MISRIVPSDKGVPFHARGATSRQRAPSRNRGRGGRSHPAIARYEIQRPMTFAMPGSAWGLNAPSQPSANSLGASDEVPISWGTRECCGGLEMTSVCNARLATIVKRSVGENRYNIIPSRSRTVMTASSGFEISTENSGTPAPSTPKARTVRSALFDLWTAEATGCVDLSATLFSKTPTPPQAYDATAYSPAPAIK